MRCFRTLLLIQIVFWGCSRLNAEEPTNYTECTKQGNTITRSAPSTCITKNGKIFIDDSFDKTKMHGPSGQLDNQELTKSPSSLTGKACKNMCGDGKCAEMVCMALGCPCAENSDTCPQDCKKSN